MHILEKFKAGILQFDVEVGNISHNISKVEDSIAHFSALNVKLLVLPEMFSCGFDNDRLTAHAKITPNILDRLSEKAKKHDMVIAGSLPEPGDSEDKIYNTLYVIDRNGEIVGTYRKIHMFSLTREKDFFASGERVVVCETSLCPIGLMTCYDLRFPEMCRILANDGAYAVILPAQWPITRIDHWDILLRARAVENQIFMIAANRVGIVNGLEYGGHSQIVSPMGNILTLAEKGENLLFAELDFKELEAYRKKFSIIEDRMLYGYF